MITVTPFLWFDDDAEAAIERYLRVFPDTELVEENRHPDGSLFVGTIGIQGQRLTLMNGGPHHRLTDAFSLAVTVVTQEEVDTISDALIAGGGTQGRCGWLVDAYGLSWQIVPETMFVLFADPDREAAGRAQAAMMTMQRLSIQGLQDAFDDRS
ncbi:VOC family protein [Aeromicrobium sp.]|uniref:VOC family protein n=1 Tax=Aeromicrobium sp. TaxID=1871063 RepID=UPI0030BB7CF1